MPPKAAPRESSAAISPVGYFSALWRGGGACRSRHLWLHVTVIPGVIALLAWMVASTGLDRTVTDFFYDASLRQFPAHGNFWLELFGHRVAKAAIWIVAGVLLVAAIGADRLSPQPGQSRALWVALAAMAFGPAVVYLLKHTTGHHCPWDLKVYGGFAEVTTEWFVAPVDAGRCFPSGHASAGYSLISLAFLGTAISRPRLAYSGFIAAVVVGAVFGAVRVAQGAHFVSHNLWAAAIDWCAAALIFCPLLWSRK